MSSVFTCKGFSLGLKRDGHIIHFRNRLKMMDKSDDTMGKETYHCHLNYRYVASWTSRQGEIIIEVYYVGSREKAPY